MEKKEKPIVGIDAELFDSNGSIEKSTVMHPGKETIIKKKEQPDPDAVPVRIASRTLEPSSTAPQESNPLGSPIRQIGIRKALAHLGKAVPTSKGELVTGATNAKEYLVKKAKDIKENSISEAREIFEQEEVEGVSLGEILSLLKNSGGVPQLVFLELVRTRGLEAAGCFANAWNRHSKTKIDLNELPDNLKKVGELAGKANSISNNWLVRKALNHLVKTKKKK